MAQLKQAERAAKPGTAADHGAGAARGGSLAPHHAAGLDFGRRRALVLAACMMAMFTAAVEGTIVATAMPTIIADLGGFRLFSWVFAVYLLTQAITIPIYGRLADLFGRKPVFFAGAGIFLGGSLLCAFAPDMTVLVLFRAIQGLGAGAIMPIASTIIGDIYTPSERARIQGWLSSVWGVSAIIGPVLGAVLVEHLNWSAIFWVNLPIGGAAIIMLALFLEERVETRRRAIDYGGALLLMLGSGTLLAALAQADALDPRLLAALLVAAVLLLAALILWERRAAEPILPLHLWRHRIILAGNLGGLTIGTVMMGITAFLPTYVQGVMGRSALVAGFTLSVMSIGWPLGSALSGRLMIRTSYRTTAVTGALALVAGNALLLWLGPRSGPLLAGAGAILIGLGMGFCNTSFLVSTQASVGWGERGIATSLNIFMRMAGSSIGAALFGGVLNWGLARRLPADHAASGDVIGRLLEPARPARLDAAEIARLTAAISDALHNVYVLASGLAVLALGLTLLLPRGAGPEGDAKRGA